MKNHLLVQSFDAAGAIDKHLIVTATSATAVNIATSATAGILGVSTDVPADLGEPCDVVLVGTARVRYGGTVTINAPLPADSTGRAVVAAPAAGVNNRIIGFATAAGVVGDIGFVLISPGFMQG